MREVAAAGARAVLVDGPLPAGSLGIDEPVEVPILGLAARPSRRACARRSPAAIPVELAVGAAAFDANAERSARRAVLVRRARVRRRRQARGERAGVGLATSEPGRNEDGAARYGTISGSSAAAALVAGAAALLAQARPDLDAAGLKQALVASARARRRGGGAAGLVDPRRAAAVELVADPPTVGLGVALARERAASGAS